MNESTIRKISVAAFAAAILMFPLSAKAAGDNASDYAVGSKNVVNGGSRNSVFRDVPLPINFNVDDIGAMITFAREICDGSPFTQLGRGNYLRQLNVASPGDGSKVPSPSKIKVADSIGNDRDDYFVFEWKPSGPDASADLVATAADLDAQLGINLGSAVIRMHAQLSSSSNGNNTALSVLDMSDPTQLLDAGANVGGGDIIMAFKNGTAQYSDIVCDGNMMYFDDLAQTVVKYGIDKFKTTAQIQRVLIMLRSGPSGFGSQGAINAACLALNPINNLTPLRCEDGSYQDPDQLGCDKNSDPNAVGNAVNPSDNFGPGWTREQFTDLILGQATPFSGDTIVPANVTSCTGFAHFCDESEPVRETKGNGCFKTGATFGGFEGIGTTANQTNNASTLLKTSFGTITIP